MMRSKVQIPVAVQVLNAPLIWDKMATHGVAVFSLSPMISRLCGALP
jgi:hypothetical protein